MLKTIGIILVSIALGAAGFLYAAWAKKRLNALEEALRAVGLLKGQVAHLLQPLGEAIRTLAPQNALLKHLAEAGCPLSGDALNEALSGAGLVKPESDILMRLFAAIPQLPAGQTGPFDAAAEQLSSQIAMQQKAVQQGGSLYPKLGLLAAFAAFLLLI
jgi:stage III sporulation protein AB